MSSLLYTYLLINPILITDECYQLYELRSLEEDFIRPDQIGNRADHYKASILFCQQASKIIGINLNKAHSERDAKKVAKDASLSERDAAVREKEKLLNDLDKINKASEANFNHGK